RHRPEPSKARHAGSGSPADTGLRGRHPSPTPLAAPSLHRPDNPQTYFFNGIGASPSLPGILGKILHRTDSGHSPWQREPLFVPPLALATPLAHSSGRSSTSPTTGNPLSCKYGPLSAVRAEGYTQFLGSIRPANRVERTRTNMSVGHAMKPMSEAHFAILRRHMVEVIEIQVDLASEDLGKAALDERVLAAMRKVPRHRSVPSFLAPPAYRDTPLPIGFDKTISQPFIVALMTDLLGPEPHESNLEVGTGLGYQAAVLAELSGRVWSVEIVEELAGQAEANLRQLGC